MPTACTAFLPAATPTRRQTLRRILVATGLSILLAACGGGDSSSATLAIQTSSDLTLPARPVRELGTLEGHQPVDMKLVQIKTLSQSTADRVTPQVIALPALAVEKAQVDAPAPGHPQRIGVARTLAQAATSDDTARLLHWQGMPNGSQRAALAVRLDGARAVRLGLHITQLPPGTRLQVYAPDMPDAEEVQASEVFRTVQHNINAGAVGKQAHTYWMPTVTGPTAVLQIELPAGTSPAQLKIALPEVSHLLIDPATDSLEFKSAAACHVDVMCTSGNDTRRTAIARMVYARDGSSYLCSGALMNNTRQDGTPYLLSANHCISDQSTASTLETYWNYRSSTCNGNTLSGDYRRVTGGAQLLWTHAPTDATLLRINGTLPSGLAYLGWNADAAPSNGPVYGIHHPAGDWQKHSAGNLQGFASCVNLSGASVSCTSSSANTGAFLVAVWSSGLTEGGSSGSPLFSSSNQVIGQLYAGGGSCSAATQIAGYGRLDWSFDAGLSQWLSPSATTPSGSRSPIYRFYNTATSAHFYTSSALERDYVIATYPSYQYEGQGFYAYGSEVSGTSPVYRFYNLDSGVHFYTISAAERDHVIATYPSYQYEGLSWYARTSSGSGATALYRFYSSQRRAHFYTINAAEMEHVRANYPDLYFEGVGYYAWTSQ